MAILCCTQAVPRNIGVRGQTLYASVFPSTVDAPGGHYKIRTLKGLRDGLLIPVAHRIGMVLQHGWVSGSQAPQINDL